MPVPVMPPLQAVCSPLAGLWCGTAKKKVTSNYAGVLVVLHNFGINEGQNACH